ncbi:ABC transporter permease [Pseudonocardia sp. ICBG1122]|nr:ABC transporter permease [Pseudonocardia pini]
MTGSGRHVQAPPPDATAPIPAVAGDDPAPRSGRVMRALARPEVGAVVATVVIGGFFAASAPAFRTPDAVSTVLYSASTIGIVALGVALLMIGGEFDLSCGVQVTSAALASSMISYHLSVNVWVGVVSSLAVALAIGFLNGWLLERTGLPSFLVTLASFFVLQGVNLGVTKLVTGTVVTETIDDMDGYESARAVFAGNVPFGPVVVEAPVVWWLLFVAIATWVLRRTRVGNWMLAVGGAAESARAVGVPVARVRTGLFMTVAFLAWFLGQHLLLNFGAVQAGLGVGNELIYIVAAVVGGCLLTGGLGSAIGAAIGAFIFGMTTQGIVFAGFDPNWFKTFLGAMLLLAVVLNLYIKNYATTRRRARR